MDLKTLPIPERGDANHFFYAEIHDFMTGRPYEQQLLWGRFNVLTTEIQTWASLVLLKYTGHNLFTTLLLTVERLSFTFSTDDSKWRKISYSA